MNYDILINRAISKTGALQLNTTFLLKDLFEGTEWNELDKGGRLGLGRRFKNDVLDGIIPNVVYIGKAQNNSAIYKKI